MMKDERERWVMDSWGVQVKVRWGIAGWRLAVSLHGEERVVLLVLLLLLMWKEMGMDGKDEVKKGVFLEFFFFFIKVVFKWCAIRV